MNDTQFKSAFLLSPISKKTIKDASSLKEAAVLMPFVMRDNQLHLLLTQRAAHLKHHPGQVSFPGGRFETTDITLQTTALRETEEEIGIDAKDIEIIGKLNHYQTISRYIVTPYVGFVSPNYQLTIDANEVDDVFEVPWRFFSERENHQELIIRRAGIMHTVHFMPFNDRIIWGTTAEMIHDLVMHFE